MRAASDLAAGEGLTGARASMQIRPARGSGIVLDSDGRPFHDASVRPAEIAAEGRKYRVSEEGGADVPATWASPAAPDLP